MGARHTARAAASAGCVAARVHSSDQFWSANDTPHFTFCLRLFRLYLPCPGPVYSVAPAVRTGEVLSLSCTTSAPRLVIVAPAALSRGGVAYTASASDGEQWATGRWRV